MTFIIDIHSRCYSNQLPLQTVSLQSRQLPVGIDNNLLSLVIVSQLRWWGLRKVRLLGKRDHTAMKSLGWKTPLEALTGITPDISIIYQMF